VALVEISRLREMRMFTLYLFSGEPEALEMVERAVFALLQEVYSPEILREQATGLL
jgi:hypothetical protein